MPPCPARLRACADMKFESADVNLIRFNLSMDPVAQHIQAIATPIAAPAGTGFVLESASVAPTGAIALAFNYGGPYVYENGRLMATCAI